MKANKNLIGKIIKLESETALRENIDFCSKIITSLDKNDLVFIIDVLDSTSICTQRCLILYDNIKAYCYIALTEIAESY